MEVAHLLECMAWKASLVWIFAWKGRWNWLQIDHETKAFFLFSVFCQLWCLCGAIMELIWMVVMCICSLTGVPHNHRPLLCLFMANINFKFLLRQKAYRVFLDQYLLFLFDVSFSVSNYVFFFKCRIMSC